MIEQEVRWQVLAPISILWALAILAAAMTDIWPFRLFGAEWLWCLAWVSAAKSPPMSAILACAWCGLARDVFLGPRMGSGMLAYVFVGWLSAMWRSSAPPGNGLERTVLVAAGALGVSWFMAMLDAGAVAAGFDGSNLLASLGTGLASGAAYPLACLLSSPEPFRTWRERGRVY